MYKKTIFKDNTLKRRFFLMYNFRTDLALERRELLGKLKKERRRDRWHRG